MRRQTAEGTKEWRGCFHARMWHSKDSVMAMDCL